jgi:hypothetical protein
MKNRLILILTGAAGLVVSDGLAQSLAFEDVTASSGIQALLTNWAVAHAAAWGDADGDGRPDLYAAAFADRPMYKAEDAPLPNQLLMNTPHGFTRHPEALLNLKGLYARTTMALFADFDNDGDLDLLLGNNGPKDDQPQSMLFENLGGARFRDATPTKGDWPRPLAIRNQAVLDLDRDGQLDMVWTDGNYANWSKTPWGGRLIALRNRGDWTWEDISDRLGFPRAETAGMGLAVGDVNDDGRLDFFVADGNQLLVSRPDGTYQVAEAGRFSRPQGGKDRHTCGAAFGDLDGDGRLDLVTAIHGQPTRLHVYRNLGVTDGLPKFQDVSAAAGLNMEFPQQTSTGHAMKLAHLAIRDFDHDGRNDLYLAATWLGPDGKPQPLVLRNLGVTDGVARLQPPSLDKLLDYYAPGPMADFDRDGRLDMFLPTWDPKVPSYLFRNVTAAGHWLTIAVEGRAKGFNRMGVGATVRMYAAGAAGDSKKLLGRQDIALGQGYSSGEEAIAHFGLGAATNADIVVTWQGQTRTVTNAPADQALTVIFD